MAQETTITSQSRIPMGMAWAILTVMSGGAYLAGAANAKIDDALAKSAANGFELNDFRKEVRGEFSEVRKTLDGLRSEIAELRSRK